MAPRFKTKRRDISNNAWNCIISVYRRGCVRMAQCRMGRTGHRTYLFAAGARLGMHCRSSSYRGVPTQRNISTLDLGCDSDKSGRRWCAVAWLSGWEGPTAGRTISCIALFENPREKKTSPSKHLTARGVSTNAGVGSARSLNAVHYRHAHTNINLIYAPFWAGGRIAVENIDGDW